MAQLRNGGSLLRRGRGGLVRGSKPEGARSWISNGLPKMELFYVHSDREGGLPGL